MFLSTFLDKVLLQNRRPLSIFPFHIPDQNQNSVEGLTEQFSIPSSQTFVLSNDINHPRSRILRPSGLLLKFVIIPMQFRAPAEKGMKLYGCLFNVGSKNLSGSKTSGLGKCFWSE